MLREQAATLSARLAPLPGRIQALMVELSEHVELRWSVRDQKRLRDAIQTEAMAIIKESWALSTEIARLAEAPPHRGPRIGRPRPTVERSA